MHDESAGDTLYPPAEDFTARADIDTGIRAIWTPFVLQKSSHYATFYITRFCKS